MRRIRPRRARGLVVVLCFALALLLALPAVASASTSLSGRITAALEKRGLAGSGTSAGVWDLSTGRALYALRLDVPRLPASNEKLVTAAAALDGWSAAHRFHTQLLEPAEGADAAGVVHGDVYLKGLGDPTLSTASFQSRHFGIHTADIADLVDKLQAAGVTRIAGRVVADDTYFDGKRSVSSWRPGMTAYCGPLSALTLNEGFGANGAYVGDPSLWAASKLTTLLRAAGIEVTHAPARGTAPASAVVAASVSSTPLSHLLAAMDKPSDDFLAEELMKDLGASFGGAGTTLAGTSVAEEFLASAGVDSAGFRIHDGSGLSYTDKLSAHAVLELLAAMARRADFLTFRASLAVAGVDGTLSDRMRGTPAAGNVHGKTGTLAAASCLSGYVTSANGHALAFSLLMNGSGLSQYEAHAAQDAVAVVLAKSAP